MIKFLPMLSGLVRDGRGGAGLLGVDGVNVMCARGGSRFIGDRDKMFDCESGCNGSGWRDSGIFIRMGSTGGPETTLGKSVLVASGGTGDGDLRNWPSRGNNVAGPPIGLPRFR